MSGKVQAIFGVAGVMILAKVLGLAREIVFAERFGTSVEYDLYLIGTMLAALAYGVLNFASFYLFVPFLTSHLEQSHADETDPGKSDQSWRSAWPLLNFSMIVGGFVTLGIIVLAPWLMKIWAADYDAAQFELIVYYCRLTAVIAFLSVSEAFFRAALNVRQVFAYPAASPILQNGIMIGVVLLFSATLSVAAIAIGLVAGLVVQNLYLLVRLAGFKPFGTYRLKAYNPEVKAVVVTAIVLVLVELLNRSYFMIDRYFAPAYGDGVISALNYCRVLISLPDAVVGLAIGSVLFPLFSKDVARPASEQFRMTFHKAVTGSVLVAVPLAILMQVCATDIVYLVFMRGAFDLSSLEMTANLLKPYSVSVVALFVITVSIRACYGRGWSKTVLIFTAGLLVIKFAATYLLPIWMGYAGIAAATSLSQVGFALMLLILVSYRAKLENPLRLFVDILKLVLAGGLALFALSLALPFIQSYYETFDRLSAILRIGWSTLILVFFYTLAAYGLGFAEYVKRIGSIKIGRQ